MKKIFLILFLVTNICLVGLSTNLDTYMNIYQADTLNSDKRNSLTEVPSCPYCQCDKHVIIKSSDTNLIYHIQFADKKSERRYFKKKNRLKYATTWEIIWPDLLNEKEKLIWIEIKDEKEKFDDPNYHWFCKKCKKLF